MPGFAMHLPACPWPSPVTVLHPYGHTMDATTRLPSQAFALAQAWRVLTAVTCRAVDAVSPRFAYVSHAPTTQARPTLHPRLWETGIPSS